MPKIQVTLVMLKYIIFCTPALNLAHQWSRFSFQILALPCRAAGFPLQSGVDI
jgi:uncharacterized oligopeptide transporter (OPT) family protein